MTRVLIVSWEYPPLIEGGLARHVRKLSEALVARDVEVHVLTRGGEESTVEEQIGGVQIHRIVEPERPTDLAEFVTWVERMNSDMLAAGVELGDRIDFDLVHGHDWLVAGACDHLARRFKAPLVLSSSRSALPATVPSARLKTMGMTSVPFRPILRPTYSVTSPRALNTASFTPSGTFVPASRPSMLPAKTRRLLKRYPFMERYYSLNPGLGASKRRRKFLDLSWWLVYYCAAYKAIRTV